MKITKRQLRRIIREGWEFGDTVGNKPEDEVLYSQVLKEVGEERFIRGLIAAIGDLEEVLGGHKGIVAFIRRFG